MIRVNLMKSVQPVYAKALDLEPPPSRAKPLVLGAVVLCAALAGGFFWFQSSQPTPPPASFDPAQATASAAEPTDPGTSTSTQVAEPEPVPEVRTRPVPAKPATDLAPSQAVEDVVREVEEEVKRSPRKITYRELAPSEKIAFQHTASSRLLSDIKRATPPKVGFSHVIVTLPGDIYVHGLAYDEENYQRLKNGLAGLQGASIRPGILRPAGERGAAMEFSLYGKVDMEPAAGSAGDRIALPAQAKAEIQGFMQLAKSKGVLLEMPELKSQTSWGNLQRRIYRTQARCSYQQLEAFLSQLPEAGSKVGILKIALRAQGDDAMAASLDLLLYVSAGGA